MTIRLSSADAAFRDEVRAFLDAELTEELRLAGRLCTGSYCDRPTAQTWLSMLNRRGWAVPTWPVQYGGTGWSVVQHYIFASELVAADAPPVTPNATRMLGPVLIAFGTPEQRAAYLPRIPTGEDWWAQGYSEPGSGSDLASLQCRADLRGDHFVINGSKIWTTHAQWSNRIFCLVRTKFDGKPQAGISFLVFDLDLPGVTIRPIITLAGDHEVNEVFFDDLRVPTSALVGRLNEGWSVAKFLLSYERGGQYAPQLRQRWGRLRTMIEARPFDLEAAAMRRRLTQLATAIEVVEAAEHGMLSKLSRGEAMESTSSMLKLQGTELLQQIDEAMIEAVGPYAAPDQSRALQQRDVRMAVGPVDAMAASSQFLNERAATIYAGSSEIQRNILSRLMLKG